MKRMKRMLAPAALAIVAATAQEKAPEAAAAKQSFEVASVKPGDPADHRVMINIAPGGRFRTVNAPLLFLIRFAYHIQDFQIVGAPDWANTERYNIEAKSAGGGADDPMKMTEAERNAFQEQLRLKVQDLLADRFGLKTHQETKEMPVYELVVAKNGPKLTPSAVQTDGKPRSGMRMGRGQLNGTAVPMSFLVQSLSDQLGRTVIDKTGLKGNFDFKLEWTPDPGEGMMMKGMAPPPGAEGPRPEPPASDARGPSLVTAIQEQLGLKLESAKGPVEMLVIDHAEKPSAN